MVRRILSVSLCFIVSLFISSCNISNDEKVVDDTVNISDDEKIKNDVVNISNIGDIDFEDYITSNEYTDYFETFNIMESNLKGYSRVNNLLCYDPLTSVLFYVGDTDNFLYIKQDNTDALILDKCVSMLQCVNDELYFLMKSDGENNIGQINERLKGAIYKYNYKTNELECLYDKNVDWFRVIKQGVLYSTSEWKDIEIEGRIYNATFPLYYLLDKNGNSHEIKDENHFTATYNDNLIQSRLISGSGDLTDLDNRYEIFLYDTKTKKEKMILQNTNHIVIFGYIKDDKYYYPDDDMNFHIIDLLTNEHTFFNMSEYETIPYISKESGLPLVIADYTVIDGDIYFCYYFGNDIYRLTKDGECELYTSLDMDDNTYHIYYLNSYFDELYAYSFPIPESNSFKPIKLNILSV